MYLLHGSYSDKLLFCGLCACPARSSGKPTFLFCGDCQAVMSAYLKSIVSSSLIGKVFLPLG